MAQPDLPSSDLLHILTLPNPSLDRPTQVVASKGQHLN